ncbi:hypothetical protein PtA15_1A931 [Puccinia triticina]|uniref:Uncharacterized protein n=1 Tax=Puccinia triticina TaxID=208348 RepID=A0ABY7C999_9BASI|nr:uncharacterized protein PtA15_1A931 [Puccinia triticina]WAQ81589.1 hypothetical protein PtA15_1A931 [Puccinia triticina]
MKAQTGALVHRSTGPRERFGLVRTTRASSSFRAKDNKQRLAAKLQEKLRRQASGILFLWALTSAI